MMHKQRQVNPYDNFSLRWWFDKKYTHKNKEVSKPQAPSWSPGIDPISGIVCGVLLASTSLNFFWNSNDITFPLGSTIQAVKRKRKYICKTSRVYFISRGLRAWNLNMYSWQMSPMNDRKTGYFPLKITSNINTYITK